MARRYDCSDATDRAPDCGKPRPPCAAASSWCCPPITVYGIGADAFSSEAAATCGGQGPGRNMPSPVAHRLAEHPARPGHTDFSEQAWELVDAFWPGALTPSSPGTSRRCSGTSATTRGTVAITYAAAPGGHRAADRQPVHGGLHQRPTSPATPSPQDCDASQEMLGDFVAHLPRRRPHTPPPCRPPSLDVTGKLPVCCARGRSAPTSCGRSCPTWR